MSKSKIIRLDSDNTIAIIENKCVSLVQELFSNKQVVVLSTNDIQTIYKEVVYNENKIR